MTVLCAFAIAVQTPVVQTFLAGRIVSGITKELHAEVKIGKIHLLPFNTIIVRDLLITDKYPQILEDGARKDTLAKVSYLSAKFSIRQLLEKEGLHISKAVIKGLDFNLVCEVPRKSNIQRMFKMKGGNGMSREDLLHIKKAIIKDSRFTMSSARVKRTRVIGEKQINWKNLEIEDINIYACDINLSGGFFNGEVEKASFRETRGFDCRRLEGKVKVYKGNTVVEDFILEDGESRICMPLYTMQYESSKAFTDFTEKVKIGISLNEAFLKSKTLRSFAPIPENIDLGMTVSTNMNGYVRSFNVSDLKARTDGDELSIRLGGKIDGLGRTPDPSVSVDIKHFESKTSGLDSLIRRIVPGSTLELGKFVPDTPITMTAKASGRFSKMELMAALESGIGDIDASIGVENAVSGEKPMEIAGKVNCNGLDLGELTASPLLGKCSAGSALRARLRGKEGAVLWIDSLMVSSINFKEKDYERIAAVGKISTGGFDGKIISQDPDCNFILQGIFTLSPKTKNGVYQFYANVGNADLHAMNIDKREISNVSFRTSVNFTNTGHGDILGDIFLNDVVFENTEFRHDVGNISISSHTSNGIYRTRFMSSFAEASFIGSSSIASFISDIGDLSLKKELPSLFRDSARQWDGSEYSLTLKCMNTAQIASYLKPGLYIDNNTSFNASIDSGGILSGKLHSRRLALEDRYIKDIDLDIDNRGDSLSCTLDCGEIQLGALKLSGNTLKASARDDRFALSLGFFSDEAGNDEGNILAEGKISRKKGEVRAALSLLPSEIRTGPSIWKIGRSDLSISEDEIKVDSLDIFNGIQRIHAGGGFSTRDDDTLYIRLQSINLEGISNLLTDGNVNAAGILDGKAVIFSGADGSRIEASAKALDTYIEGISVGNMSAGAVWDSAKSWLKANLSNEKGGRKDLDIQGDWYPSGKRLSLRANLDKFDLSPAKPFLSSVLGDISGKVTANVSADGTLDDIVLSSEKGSFEDVGITVAFTSVPYTLNGPFHLDESGVFLDNIDVKDKFGMEGVLSGGLILKKKPELNAKLSFNRMQLIDIPEKDNPGIYGELSGTGDMEILGPLDDLSLNINVWDTSNGKVHVPLSSKANAESVNLLKFKQKEIVREYDAYEEMMAKAVLQKMSSLKIRIEADANKNVEALLEIDKSSGNVISAKGEGHLGIDISDSKFNMTGDYVIDSGNYRFGALGIASRDFIISSGSSIKFEGDIMDSVLDIDASYKTKASISTLIADTTSVSNRRTVNCDIKISDRLRNPALDFNIDIPDLEPSVKSRVESALSTEDKVQKQFLSLLLSNSFLPDEQSGIFNNESVLYSNVAEIMAGQLNNILQKLDIPVDLGLKYQPGDNGNDLFDVAVSTQLFNNRVILNGNIANRQYGGTGTGSDVVGDFDIEIKIDRSGAVRLTLFSHSADQYTNYLDNSQRNGIGITYQKDFNNFREMMESLFAGRKKREEINLKQEERRIREGVKTIEIL